MAEAESKGVIELMGYCLVLMSAATRMARIYSIAFCQPPVVVALVNNWLEPQNVKRPMLAVF